MNVESTYTFISVLLDSFYRIAERQAGYFARLEARDLGVSCQPLCLQRHGGEESLPELTCDNVVAAGCLQRAGRSGCWYARVGEFRRGGMLGCELGATVRRWPIDRRWRGPASRNIGNAGTRWCPRCSEAGAYVETNQAISAGSCDRPRTHGRRFDG